jgi:hypothetical protein
MTFPDRPLFRNLLDEGETLVLYGPSNIGKSALTMNIALQGAAGAPGNMFLDTWPVERPLRTLFIQAENSGKAVQRRINQMFQGRPEWRALTGAVAELIDPETGHPLVGKCTDPNFIAIAKEAILAHKADLFIVDPLISYHDGNENGNNEMRDSLDKLTALCWETKAACIVVHHIGKGNNTGPRGAQAIFDWADNVLKIEDDGYRPNENKQKVMPSIQLTLEKSRNDRKGTTVFARMDEHLVFNTLGEAEKTSKRERLELVKDTLVSMGGICKSQKALAQAVQKAMRERGEKPLGERSIYSLINDAVTSGLLEAHEQGRTKTFNLAA